MQATLPDRLTAAFAEGVATAYWDSYQRVLRDLDAGLRPVLITVVNGLLERMEQRRCSAYQACAAVLPQLETDAGKRMAMAAAVVIVEGGLKAGKQIKELPTTR